MTGDAVATRRRLALHIAETFASPLGDVLDALDALLLDGDPAPLRRYGVHVPPGAALDDVAAQADAGRSAG